MISQRCPKCLSKRIRRGYRPTPLWSKILFRYNLLCDSCNWEFVGFAVPGTVSAKPTKRAKKHAPRKDGDEQETQTGDFSASASLNAPATSENGLGTENSEKAQPAGKPKK